MSSGGDIRVPREEDDRLAQPPSNSPRRRVLSFRQVIVLAVLAVLATSGMVPPADIALVLFSVIYLHFLSAAAFPPLRPVADPPVFGAGNRRLAAYVLAGGVVGLLLPVAYILDGVLAGDKESVKAAAPHVFLLAAQVFLEGVTFSGGFSLPMRAFVPIFYNTKRLFTIVDWLASEVGKAAEGEQGAGRRVLAGRALAVANLGFWAFNLFGFLLPVYLPRAFKRYYSGYNNDTKSKD